MIEGYQVFQEQKLLKSENIHYYRNTMSNINPINSLTDVLAKKNYSMTEEDRTMARFTAERMKHHNRKSIYNLADDEILTHRGQTLSEIEKFDDPRSDDDDDEDEEGRKSSGKLDDSFVGDAHFGGGVLTKTGKDGAKSHKDLIDQLIAESKKRKAEKQKTKEETLELTEKLDSDWKDLLPLVSKSKKSDEDKPEVQQKPDDYDKVMRELKFEARGNPTDRLKSEDEIAREEKERLEKLEQDRLNRMMGITEKPTDKRQHRSADDLDDNFNYNSDPEETLAYDEEGKMKNGFYNETETKEPNVAKAEDEDTNCEEEESSEAETDDDMSDLKESESDSDEEKEKQHNEIKINNKQENVFNKTNITDEKTELEKKQEKTTERKRKLSETLPDKSVSDLKESESDSDEEKEVQHNEININNKQENVFNKTNIKDEKRELEKKQEKTTKRKRKLSETLSDKSNIKVQKTENPPDIIDEKQEIEFVHNDIIEKAKKELPYTYSLPESYESLQSLLNNQPPEYQDVIIERMIKCNHPSLASENKENLARLFVYLLQHLNDVAPENNVDSDNFKTCFAVLNSVTPHLYTLTQLNPQNAKDSLIEIIKEKQNDYRKKQKQYPGIDVLVYLKLISCLFSTSDFRHQVVTPAFVFISQMLTNCKVKTPYDVAYGLFLVTLFIEYTSLSKRYLPAVIIYLMGILHMAVPKIGVRVIKIHPPFKSNSTALVLAESCKVFKFDSKMTTEDFVHTEFDKEFKIKSLYLTLKLCQELQENWKNLSSDIDIFDPFYNLLAKLPKINYPKNIKDQIEQMINNNIEIKKNKKLSYIVIEQKKPKALRLYEPNIQQVFEYRRGGKPMSRERAEREKLIYRYKKETKGALREIRRDKSFLGRVKIKHQIQSDFDRREKVKRIYAEASIQQSELNAMDRKKKTK